MRLRFRFRLVCGVYRCLFLHGHVRGAFTGANAARKGLIENVDNGTLFLDEIANLPSTASLRQSPADYEEKLIRHALTKNDWNQDSAAA